MMDRASSAALRTLKERWAFGLALLLLLPGGIEAQSVRPLAVILPGNPGATLPLASHRGYPAFDAAALAPLGWAASAEPGGAVVVLRHRTGITLRFNPGSPFLTWDGRTVQLVHPPYWFGTGFLLPLQVAVDLLPGFLPHAYRFDADRFVLEVEGASSALASPLDAPPPTRDAPGALSLPNGTPGVAEGIRVVVIDPGHGGEDPGAIGPRGLREKDVALGIGRALARELAGDPGTEVRFTRERDEAVPLWSRGEQATLWKGDRPGVFISIHANALPDRPGVRGFETYFLSEARDEHERRVAALENAAPSPVRPGTPAGQDPLLGAILQDLRTFDHQHWSADLAEEVQRELGRIHPGPDRGVKQGPFAVITNALMPSVLVEVGFLTNPDEERLLADSAFQEEAARAIARAIRAFFDRYPPGR